MAFMFRSNYYLRHRILGAAKTTVISGLIICTLLLSAAAPVRAATVHEIGISTSATMLRMSNAKLDARLTDIERLGATWIRVDFNWPMIQPKGPNAYSWGPYDRIVRVAGVHHLKILAVLGYTPKWAQEPRCAKLVITEAAGQKCNPADNNTFANFARVVSLRYSQKSVHAWEIWNEPNLSSYWKTANPDKTVLANPLAYARLANATAYQIRKTDPSAKIITGGMAPLFEPKYPKGYRQSDYLARILPHLNASLFDGIGIHPYSWPVLPTKAVVYNAYYSVDKGRPQYNLRYIMDKAGWGNKQIWGTEFGAPTTGLTSLQPPTATFRPDHVSESTQAQIVNVGISEWYKKANVGPLIVHSDSDQWLRDYKNEDGFGLRRSDGSKKPSFSAFQNQAAKLQQTPQK